MGLGQLALARGNPAEAIPLFEEAKVRFLAIGLPNWAAQAEELLAQASGNGAAETGITLAELAKLVKDGRAGDRAAGERAFQFLTELALSGNAETAALGRALRLVLLGDAPEKALADLPESVAGELRQLLGNE